MLQLLLLAVDLLKKTLMDCTRTRKSFRFANIDVPKSFHSWMVSCECAFGSVDMPAVLMMVPTLVLAFLTSLKSLFASSPALDVYLERDWLQTYMRKSANMLPPLRAISTTLIQIIQMFSNAFKCFQMFVKCWVSNV